MSSPPLSLCCALQVGALSEKMTLMILVALIPPLNMEAICNAAYFVFHKVGDIKSGLGAKYQIIGQV
jgi:hypothetical protein